MFLVENSNTPLVFDALPAIKTRHFSGGDDEARIYTLGKLYVYDGSLVLNLTAFEREPAADSRVLFAFGAEGGGTMPVVSLSPGAALLAECKKNAAGIPQGRAALSGAERFSGVDEQGWYWGATVVLGPEHLAQAGLVPKHGATFRAALLKVGAGGGWGVSHRPSNGEQPLHWPDFETYTIE